MFLSNDLFSETYSKHNNVENDEEDNDEDDEDEIKLEGKQNRLSKDNSNGDDDKDNAFLLLQRYLDDRDKRRIGFEGGIENNDDGERLREENLPVGEGRKGGMVIKRRSSVTIQSVMHDDKEANKKAGYRCRSKGIDVMDMNVNSGSKRKVIGGVLENDDDDNDGEAGMGQLRTWSKTRQRKMELSSMTTKKLFHSDDNNGEVKVSSRNNRRSSIVGGKTSCSPSNWGNVITSPSRAPVEKAASFIARTSSSKKKVKQVLSRAEQLKAATGTCTMLGRQLGRRRKQEKAGVIVQDGFVDGNGKSNGRARSPTSASKSWPKWESATGGTMTPQFFGPKFLGGGSSSTSKPRSCPSNNNGSKSSTPKRRSGSDGEGRKRECKEDGPTVSTPSGDDDRCRATLSPTFSFSHNQYEPTKRRQPTGPLLRTLFSIRTATESDIARFQSGSFPYRTESNRRMDVNDPRNRAHSHMDVTVLGLPVPWTTTGLERAVVWGYVHKQLANHDTGDSTGDGGLRSVRVTRTVGRRRIMLDPVEDPALHDDNCRRPVSLPKHAWICFAHETLHGLGVVPGTQLRLYDAIIIPSCAIANNNAPIVLCTRVSELYSEQLTPLSDPTCYSLT